MDSPITCPSGGRSVAIPVADGPRKGLLSLMVVPAGAEYALQPPWADRPGAQGAVVVAKSGKQLVVVIEPVAGSAAPPLDAADTRDIADGLKPQF
ncbi:hypothetical protein ACFPM7_01330 [Actinokineospora guangxiensis]|uniref:Uncharacterized protein n=1 Tax=Actinokineospora guangxiensis TaxID=1490288 RepID=A0ABW0EJJ6_9PSEU